MSDLKDCPFCGGAARKGITAAYCQVCYASSASTMLGSDAITVLWNRRAISPAVKALVEACRTLIARRAVSSLHLEQAVADVELEIKGDA